MSVGSFDGTETNKSSSNRNRAQQHWKNANARTSCLHYLGVMSYVLLITLPFVIAIATLRSTSLESDLAYLATGKTLLLRDLELFKTGQGNFTLTGLYQREEALTDYRAELESDLKLAFHIYLGINVLHFGTSVFLACMAYVFRKKTAVISRGIYFISHLVLAPFLFEIASIFFVMVAYLQIDRINPVLTGDVQLFKNYYFAASIFMLFCGSVIWSVPLFRMSLVYRAFSATRIKKGDTLLIYLYPTPVALFLFFLSITSIAIYTFTDNDYHVLVKSSTSVIVGNIYAILIGLMTYLCRSIAVKYSDFYSNSRACFLLCVQFWICYFLDAYGETLLCGVIFTIAGHVYSTTYLLDQAASACYYYYLDYTDTTTSAVNKTYTGGQSRGQSKTNPDIHSNLEKECAEILNISNVSLVDTDGKKYEDSRFDSVEITQV